MKRRTNAHDLVNAPIPETELRFKEALFVAEYLKDCSPRRAAEAAGYSPDRGSALIEKPNIQAAINYILSQKVDDAIIDADWVLYELADNHSIARQRGQIAASTTALINIGKHKRVDAFVAKEMKVELNTNDEVMEKLRRGRDRNASRKCDEPNFF